MSMFLHRQPMRLDRYLANNFKPNLVLDFVRPFYRFNFQRGGAFSDLTFSRTSTATFVDSDGILQTASSGTARVGHHVYEGGQWVNKGILLESEARTNKITFSDDFTDASWNKTGVTVSGSVLTATTSTSNLVSKDPSYNSSTQYTVWAEVEDIDAGYAYVSGFDGTDDFGAMFNLSTGNFVGYRSATTNDNFWITEVGPSRYLIGVTFTTGTASPSSFGFGVGLSTDGSLNFASTTNGEQIIVYRAQVEEGATPSSYIPTSGATATRAAESRTTPAAKMFYSGTAMSGAFEYLITYADTGTATEQTLFDWRVDANNRITVTLDTAGANTGKVTLTVVNGGTSKAISTTADLSPGLNVAAKVAWRVTASEVNIALNGTAETAESNTAGVPNLSTADATVGDQIISALERGWSADIGDTGIAEATS